MFYALCAAICLAVLFIVMSVTLLLSSGGGWFLRRFGRALPPALLSNAVLGLRLLPVLAALLFILAVALPAFVELEPRSTDEGLGLKLFLFAGLGAVVLSRFALEWYRLHRRTSRLRRQLLRGAEPLSLSSSPAPVYAVEESRGLVAVVGTLRPRVFVARGVLAALTPAELKAVLAHEIGHVRAFDNLKQFLLKITRPPAWLRGLASLDGLWTHASEMAADEAALSGGAEVEDLASALIKVSRLGQSLRPADVAACHLVPDAGCSALGERVLHLQELLNGNSSRNGGTTHRRFKVWGWSAAAALVFAYMAALPVILPAVHEAIEWLVR